MRTVSKFAVALTAAAALAVGGFTASGAASDVSPNDPGAPPPPELVLAAVPPTSETVYETITPCRIVDTRLAGGKIGSGSVRNFQVVGGGGAFPGQGGKAGGCAIPEYATAISVSITSVSPSAAGYLRAWPYAESEPNATILNYGTFNMGTGVTLPITSGPGPNLKVRNFYGPTHVVIDVLGFYEPQIQATINSAGGVKEGGQRVTAATRTGVGSYRIEVAGNLTGCTPIASIEGGGYIAAAYKSGQYIYANTYAKNNTTYSGWTLTDLYWTLTVLC